MSKKPTTSSIMRDNSKADYQPWRHGDFKSDIYVQAMSATERWMYQTLLHEAFDYSTRPYLPDDDNILWMLAGCESKKQWNQHKEAVRARFISITIDGQKLLSQKKCLEDWRRVMSARTARQEAGRKGGKARASNAQAMLGDTQAEPKPSQAEFKQNQASKVKRSKGSKGSKESLPTNSTSDGGSDGSNAKPSTGSKSADKALSGWRLELQQRVQKVSAEKCPDCVVFSVPLPGKVFDFIERMAENCGMEKSQDALIEWLDARSFDGLLNPNVVWDKMPDEIYGFVS